jgi:hypothetical protein
MKLLISGTLLAFALVTAPVITSPPAAAAVDFSISLGNAAFGFSDGYWDRDHQWHTWRSRDEQRYFQSHYGEHYVNARHDRDRDQGWRNERWWDRDRDGDRDRDRDHR